MVNAPRPGAVQYFDTLIRQFAEIDWGRNRRILILTDAWPEGLPAELQELGAVHVHGSGAQEGMLAVADAASAAVIIVLAEDHVAQQADSIAFDVVHRARVINSDCSIVAECGDDRNRARLREAGATSVVRPMRGYPEMMVRAVVSPGSEFILEDLFDARGDECRRYEISVDGVTWGQLASTLMAQGHRHRDRLRKCRRRNRDQSPARTGGHGPGAAHHRQGRPYRIGRRRPPDRQRRGRRLRHGRCPHGTA